MKFNIITIFPEAIKPYLDSAILWRAQNEGLIEINIINLRDYTNDRRKTVDDTPYGGGAGMIMKAEPIFKALENVRNTSQINVQNAFIHSQRARSQRTILTSAKGKQFTQSIAKKYAKLDELTIICGRYEGVDQRVADKLCDEEISIGPFVLAGGELAAMTILEATARNLKGVLGNSESLDEESFSDKSHKYKEYPQYTKPEIFNKWKVPKVLLSGNHKKIKEWRDKHTERNK